MMFGVWKKIVFAAFLVSNFHFVTTLSCYCTTHSNVKPVFENLITAKDTSKIILGNKCFTGSIHGQLFCPENYTFCIKLEDLHFTSCDETSLNSESTSSTIDTAEKLTLEAGIEFIDRKRFVLADDGKWGEWAPWEQCVVSVCDRYGVHRRTRKCSAGEHNCLGDHVDLKQCYLPCVPKVDGQWSGWTTWSTCASYTAKNDLSHRLRKCDNPAPSHGGENCHGKGWEIIACSELTGWETWGSWSDCYQTARIDLQFRNRTCRNDPCDGESLRTRLCHEAPKFKDWGPWGACSLTCGLGVHTRHRQCDNGTLGSNSSIVACVGNSSESKQCLQTLCSGPVQSYWSEWTAWTFCEPPCDSGTSSRHRDCYGNSLCQGVRVENETCSENVCKIKGGWSTWEEWSICNVGRTSSVTVRVRNCSNPYPKNSGENCIGKSWDIEPCKQESAWGAWIDVGHCVKYQNNVTEWGLQYRSRTCHKGLKKEHCVGKDYTFDTCELNGIWTEWGNWSACSVTCGDGIQNRHRHCQSDTDQCKGNENSTQTCTDVKNCPVDGKFSEWSQWNTCHVTCGGGAVTRNRYCNNPKPQYGGNSCVGSYTETDVCNTNDCPVDGHFTDWLSWQPCSVTCGNGTKERTRSCTNPAPSNGGTDCNGPSKDTDTCNEAVCSVDGEWGQWQAWAQCTCEHIRQKKRDCDNPAPVADGAYCVGDATVTSSCEPDTSLLCPVAGGWADWLQWETKCSVTCGRGVVNRFRQCVNPIPTNGGAYCAGQLSQTRDCIQQPCPVDGVWSSWTAWSPCDVTCGNGTHFRNRTCNNPMPQFGGKDCRGRVDDSNICTQNPCPINGMWGEWLAWSSWDVTCAHGSRSRIRKCENPAPSFGGHICSGDFNGHESRDLGHCKVDGALSSWTTWTTCSVTCENGTQSRTRTCSNPFPKYGGLDCVGERNETQVCSDKPSCTIDGGWSEWSNWFGCSVTCGQGIDKRYRACNNPLPQNGGIYCHGPFSESTNCTLISCPVDGNWTDWGSWASCSVSCSDGTSVRNRTCSNPHPEYGGKQCDGNTTEVRDCNLGLCKIDGSWSDWSAWFGCSDTCGNGTNHRYRACNNPVPENGGKYCQGSFSGSVDCTLIQCPVDGEWSDWESWGSCSVTCSNGTSTRNRSCSNPYPKYGGKQCFGDATDMRECVNEVCKIDGNWAEWGSWDSCSVTCSKGTSARNRTCDNPKPENGGKHCSGTSTEIVNCFERDCPMDGSWGNWTPWSRCMGDCHGGNKQRYRNCDNPMPVNGGQICPGPPFETVKCLPNNCANERLRAAHQVKTLSWSRWFYSTCTTTCGPGTTIRLRHCYSGYDDDCHGNSTEIVTCNLGHCPEWLPYQQTKSCSVTCGKGYIQMRRECSTGKLSDCGGSEFTEIPCVLNECI